MANIICNKTVPYTYNKIKKCISVTKKAIENILKEMSKGIAKAPLLEIEQMSLAHKGIAKGLISQQLLKFQENHYEGPNFYAYWKNILESQKSVKNFTTRLLQCTEPFWFSLY